MRKPRVETAKFVVYLPLSVAATLETTAKRKAKTGVADLLASIAKEYVSNLAKMEAPKQNVIFNEDL